MFNKLINDYRDRYDRFRRSMAVFALPLKVVCYVLGGGAFGVFVRWLQVQMAFDSKGLNVKSVFNYLVPVMMLAIFLVVRGFWKSFEKKNLVVPADYNEALGNYGAAYGLVRGIFGAILCLGALALFSSSETDRNVLFYRVLSLLALLSGVSIPLYLGRANTENDRPRLACLLALPPVLMFAWWLVTCYKVNDINSVLWSFAVELAAICVSMAAFFRVAGFVFGMPAPKNTFLACGTGAALCLMALADERYAGLQMMFFTSALFQALFVWILTANLQKHAPQEAKPSKRSPKYSETDEDGFVKL